MIQTPIYNLVGEIRDRVNSVFDYIWNDQPYDNRFQRHDHADVRPKSYFEPGDRQISYLRTRRKQYNPSQKLQRLSYEPVDQATQSDVTGTHFGCSVADKDIWPYYNQDDRWPHKSRQAPVYVWEKSRKSIWSDSNEDPEPEIIII